MNKILKACCLCLVLSFQLKAMTNATNNRGEAVCISVSPFSVLQEKDTALKLEYQQVKKLYKEEHYSKTLKQGLILLSKVEKEDDKELEYLCNFLIGEAFRKINNHQKALLYFKKALLILQEHSFVAGDFKKYNDAFQDTYTLAENLLKIGTGYHLLNQKDSARFYYKKVVETNALKVNDLIPKASAYANLSGIYLEESNFILAKIYALKAVEIHKNNKNSSKEAAALGNLASIYVELKEYEKAKNIYLKALGLIEDDKTSSALKYREDLYFNIAYALYLLKDYTAYDYQEKSYNIKDSIRDAEIQHIIKGVFEKHQIELVKNKVALKKAEERRATWFLGILSMLIVVISGVILFNYRLRQKNLKLQLIQNKLAEQSNLEKLKSESQMRVLNATLDGKESERKQIAETLHDSVSALLSSASLHLQASTAHFNGEAPVEIKKSQKIITETSEKIRELSHTLMSSMLLKFGLKYAINDMAEKYSNSQISIKSEIRNIRRYDQNFEIKINNIIQEFVNNLLKHSNATDATVSIVEKENKLHINIEDNGIGFDTKNIVQKDGLGINQIEARVQMMDGSFEIDSQQGKGTRICIVLPVFEKENTTRA
ncbi:MAG: tetratricopeptide repeat protein [Polaribacter sp.]|nr:tetratricopeptide repeat protein [Polaribacter sp.]